jgi:hypothetical protein
MKVYWRLEVYLLALLTSAPDGGECSASHPGSFTPGERAPLIHWTGGWVGPRTGVDTVAKREISDPCRDLNPGHPAHSPALYHWAIPAPTILNETTIKVHLGLHEQKHDWKIKTRVSQMNCEILERRWTARYHHKHQTGGTSSITRTA